MGKESFIANGIGNHATAPKRCDTGVKYDAAPADIEITREREWRKTIELLAPGELAQLRQAFNLTDVNYDGSLDAVELCRTLHKMGLTAAKPARMMELMKRYDEDDSGVLDFEEVRTYVCAYVRTSY